MRSQHRLLALSLVRTSAWANEDISKVNGRISAEAGQVDGALDTLNGAIEIGAGAQTKSVESVNGSIGLLETDLGTGIETVNGDITVGVGSHGYGGIEVTKPNVSFSFKPSRKLRVVIGPNAVVDGPLQFEREVSLSVQRSAKIGAVTRATARRFDSDVAPQD
ncbi:hypothetical protein ACFQS6_24760 [Xanthomonas populi]|uniref:Uncharacterized protein n=1 Tax=Xanthomonas populi TaxID=53414 RepID=A0A2S7ER13_9XANT|nr:hypothetical protein [Xanthomonas populi]PPU95539.1 hypothetical protein XpopCFBP1817_08550 [Xanthomonas populi]